MSALHIVRRIKSALDAGLLSSTSPHRNGDDTQQSTNDEQASSTRTRLGKPPHNLRQTRVSSIGSQSFSTLRSQPERTIVDLRRRLARKASVFSLRAKRWKAEIQGREREQEQEQEQDNNSESVGQGAGKALNQEKLSPRTAEDSPNFKVQANVYNKANGRDLATPEKGLDISPASSIATVHPTHIQSDLLPEKQALSAFQPRKPLDQLDPVQAHIHAQQENYLCEEIAGGIICVNMSSEQAPPPVPYTRLKEITENV